MIARTLREVAEIVGGSLRGDDRTVDAIATDSRDVRPGAMFVALLGERLDGHAYAADALAGGAEAALVRRGAETADLTPIIEVADTGEALLALAADERARRSRATVVAITGANGKTSTKDLTAAVLAGRFRTHASPASFNNEVGLPRTLLGAPDDAEVIVAELGARREGDVARLCAVARPDVAVVTNVGLAHMEVFGSWDAIVRAGVEPVRALPPHGTAVLNADDAVVRGYADLAPCRVLTFGVASDADVRASDVVLDDDGVATFDLEVGRDSERIRLSVPGAHMVSNALAAGAVGIALGIDAAACAIALKGARVSRWRMEVSERPDGVRIVNDAYNANPESMIAGVKAARVIARGRRLVLVLGHMAELGPISMEEHERLGRLLVRIGIERLVTVGPEAEAIARAAIREGQLPEDVAVCADPESATAEVRGWIRPGDVVFLKGSRVAGLERVAEALR